MNTTTLQTPVNAIKYGTPGGTRTRDLGIKSPLLYHLSYGSMWCARQDSNLQPKGYEPAAPPLGYKHDWYRWRDLNPQENIRWILSPLRMPFRHTGKKAREPALQVLLLLDLFESIKRSSFSSLDYSLVPKRLKYTNSRFLRIEPVVVLTIRPCEMQTSSIAW